MHPRTLSRQVCAHTSNSHQFALACGHTRACTRAIGWMAYCETSADGTGSPTNDCGTILSECNTFTMREREREREAGGVVRQRHVQRPSPTWPTQMSLSISINAVFSVSCASVSSLVLTQRDACNLVSRVGCGFGL